MNITGLDVAILLNFKNAKLEWKRLVNERRKDTGQVAPDGAAYAIRPQSCVLLLPSKRGLLHACGSSVERPFLSARSA